MARRLLILAFLFSLLLDVSPVRAADGNCLSSTGQDAVILCTEAIEAYPGNKPVRVLALNTGRIGAGNTLDARGAPKAFRASRSQYLGPFSVNPIGTSTAITSTNASTSHRSAGARAYAETILPPASRQTANQPALAPSTPATKGIL